MKQVAVPCGAQINLANSVLQIRQRDSASKGLVISRSSSWKAEIVNERNVLNQKSDVAGALIVRPVPQDRKEQSSNVPDMTARHVSNAGWTRQFTQINQS